MESLYTADQIRCAAWYVRSYRQAIEKARQGIKIKIDWACSGLDEAGLRKEFITALFSRIDSKAGIKHAGRKWQSNYQTELMRDCRNIRDHATSRLAVHQIITPELKTRFGHIVSECPR